MIEHRLNSLLALSLMITAGAAFSQSASAADQATQFNPEQLGRLFFSPEQRTDIERTRSQPIDSAAGGSQSEVPVLTEAPPALIRFDGIAHRPQRSAVIWINGRALEEESALYRYRLHIDAGALVLTDQTGQRFRLSVGQLFDMDRGAILDTVPPNAVEVARR
ncbi:hypothetical protein [Pseudomarimonas arenosa]|uniref:Uncharacterized protein n=1 Tax=Pseudomarimonas arenosa TaxID=2774145 RepID=A0AAW3ZJ42_9GAMM|nr:hypothetical protein [Pseudomarimonas arenosa]MBD8526003.1 hypothetical protein [Pseudomarimonas arenosa]